MPLTRSCRPCETRPARPGCLSACRSHGCCAIALSRSPNRLHITILSIRVAAVLEAVAPGIGDRRPPSPPARLTVTRPRDCNALAVFRNPTDASPLRSSPPPARPRTLSCRSFRSPSSPTPCAASCSAPTPSRTGTRSAVTSCCGPWAGPWPSLRCSRRSRCAPAVAPEPHRPRGPRFPRGGHGDRNFGRRAVEIRARPFVSVVSDHSSEGADP